MYLLCAHKLFSRTFPFTHDAEQTRMSFNFYMGNLKKRYFLPLAMGRRRGISFLSKENTTSNVK